MKESLQDLMNGLDGNRDLYLDLNILIRVTQTTLRNCVYQFVIKINSQ